MHDGPVRAAHHVPASVTRLIGRTADLAAIVDVLTRERLVTLAGPGGIGKTRLALAVAGDAGDRYPGGVFWVDLSVTLDDQSVGRAVLTAISAGEVPGAIVERQVAVELGDDPALLVLDTCEHVLAGAAELTAGVLAANPAITIVTTSREPLGVVGEVVWRVEPLSYPASSAATVVSLEGHPAAELFVVSVRRARPTWDMNDAEAPHVAAISARLDGIPLAIELAAARARQFSLSRDRPRARRPFPLPDQRC